MASQRVWATPAAVDAIVHLHAQLGNLVLRHVAGAGGRAGGATGQLDAVPRGPDDVCLGTVGGVLFLIDRRHDLALGCPDFKVDATPAAVHDDDDGVHAQYHLISRAIPRDDPELGPARSGVDQAVLERVAGQLGPGAEAELLLDVGAVGLDRADAELERFADLAVGVAERHQPQDVGLARRERLRGGVLGARGRARRRPRAARSARPAAAARTASTSSRWAASLKR